MTRRRWIADEVPGDTAALVGEHAAHLARVLRAEVGQEFDIAAGEEIRRGTITSISYDRVEFALDAKPHRRQGSSHLPLRKSLWSWPSSSSIAWSGRSRSARRSESLASFPSSPGGAMLIWSRLRRSATNVGSVSFVRRPSNRDGDAARDCGSPQTERS